MVGRVWPRHGHRGRPLNSVVRTHCDMGRAGLVLGIVASAVILLVGAQIIITGSAYMPIVASRFFWTLRNVGITGFPAYAIGMAWLCGGLAILANLASTRIASYSSRLIALRNILLAAVGASFLIAVIGQVARVYGNSAF
jgi:hypothetical protein